MTLGTICEFKLNFENADFWLIRKGSEKTVGTPTRSFNEENIGVKVREEYLDRVLPDFIFYYFQYLQQIGMFSQLSHGTLQLKNISLNDIKNLPVSFQ